jgi:hypothetical protein
MPSSLGAVTSRSTSPWIFLAGSSTFISIALYFADPNFDPDTVGGQYVVTAIPEFRDILTPSEAEGWFEYVDLLVAAREARERYVMISLGAHFGFQTVAAYCALNVVNPLPCKLVALEAVPGNCEWIAAHMRNNRIDPDAHWILPYAINDSADPLYFPVTGPGCGANNCFSTNETTSRQFYVQTLLSSGKAEEALRNILLQNTTGLMKELVPGMEGEIKLISSITLNEVLGPFDRVDYLEADIQQSEILVFPPFIDLLRRKVRRIHIGTHGDVAHEMLHKLFQDDGWEIVFSYAPNARHHCSLGSFETNDGILTVRNPTL